MPFKGQAVVRQIKGIAASVIRAETSDHVLVEDSFGATGDSVLSITIVLKPRKGLRVRAEDANEIAFLVRQALHARGEERYPQVGFVTTSELKELNSESAP